MSRSWSWHRDQIWVTVHCGSSQRRMDVILLLPNIIFGNMNLHSGFVRSQWESILVQKKFFHLKQRQTQIIEWQSKHRINTSFSVVTNYGWPKLLEELWSLIIQFMESIAPSIACGSQLNTKFCSKFISFKASKNTFDSDAFQYNFSMQFQLFQFFKRWIYILCSRIVKKLGWIKSLTFDIQQYQLRINAKVIFYLASVIATIFSLNILNRQSGR